MPGHRSRGGARRQGHEVHQEPGDDRALRDLMDQTVTGKAAEVGHRLVGAVEQPELHQLVRFDVGNQLHPNVFRPAAGGEGIL